MIFLFPKQVLISWMPFALMLIAIGENLKNLEKISGGMILPQYPEMDWKGAKGMRDIISHHYFDVDAEVVFFICRDRIPFLLETVRRVKDSL
mgnify:FL=1